MKLRTALLGAVCGDGPCARRHLPNAAPMARSSCTFPQAVSIMNPYLSGGTKDVYAASMVLEAAGGPSPEGVLIPKLVTEIPTVENGGVSADMTSITWKLKPACCGRTARPVTAADAVFTWQYCTHPEGGCAQATVRRRRFVEAVDD
jgi:peptide/nickel transport system substrate-binding protein